LPCQDATSAVPAGSDDSAELDGYRSLLECLEAVPEPRRKCGIRHRAAVVLAFAVAGVLAGADSMTAITEWAADAPSDVLAALDARCDRRGRRVPPSPSTFRRLLRLLALIVVAAQKPGQRGPATCTTTLRGNGGFMTPPLPAPSVHMPDLHRS